MKILKQFKTIGILALGLAALAGINSSSAEKFTIGVISDTQNYNDITMAQPRGVNTFIQQMQYIADQKQEKNIVFVSHIGDVVQHGDGQFRTGIVGQYTYWDTRSEWDYANIGISVLSESGIPFSIVPGNHDYDNYSWYDGFNSPGKNRPLKLGSVFNLYFGPQSRHFVGKDWYGGAYGGGLNSFQIFEAAGKKMLHIGLEQEPSARVLDWAQRVVDTNPDMPIIVTTHEWIEPNFKGKTDRSNNYKNYFEGTDHLPPDEIWDQFIRKNSRIFMVLSGHHYTPPVAGVSNGQNMRVDKNEAGFPVYQLVQDYQGNTVGLDGKPETANGGAGWMRFIEFDTKRQKIHFYTYSTLLNKYAGRDGEHTFGQDPSFSDFEIDFPPQLADPIKLKREF
ncbi:metallophosphoesterase [Bartonella sp. HY038]|uniref:metallophosphoesterase n=1 Tax=Bartonella sp. HY038 TaxID=2759660 RepID=UPI0015FD741C|nr:metallophosphoesterase [Bartonella sp. HY038]